MKNLTSTKVSRPRHLTPTLLSAALLLAASSINAGPILRLSYTGLPTGAAVSTLTNAPNFPASPDFGTVLLDGLKSPAHVLPDSSGTWIRGFIDAPQTGPYTFWIAGDDDAELWLSTSHDPAGIVKIAENINYLEIGQYNLKPAQKSAPIILTTGQKYYFEARQKEDFGGDHVEVMWQLPDGTQQDPVNYRHLWPFPVDTASAAYPALEKAPAILNDYLGELVPALQATTSVVEGEAVDMVVSVEASQPAHVQWSRNSVLIRGANFLSYRIPAVKMSENNVTYSVTVTNSLGQASASTVLVVSQDVTPPVIDDALALGDAVGSVAVVFSEAVSPTTATNAVNYTFSGGLTSVSAEMGSRPNTVVVKTSGLAANTAYDLTVNNVQDTASAPNTISPGSMRVVETDLLTWLKLDEFSGTTVNDASVNSLHGSLEAGAAPGNAGKILKSLRFDGLDDYVELQDGYADFAGGLTFALWVKPQPVIGVGWARFVELANGMMADNNILFARQAQTEKICFQAMNGTAGGPQISSRDLLTINQWQHLAVTMDPSGATTIYFNGEPVATGASTVPPNVNRVNCRLGRSNFTMDSYYAGFMDDVRIYNRALSASAVGALAAGSGADDGPAIVVTAAATVAGTALENTPPGIITVTRSPASATDLAVQYIMEGTAINGTHYTNLPGTLTISSNAASAEVQIAPIAGSFTDAFRTATLRVSGSADYAVGDESTATVTIANNADVIPPKPVAATAAGRTINVWFDEPVSAPSATAVTNFTLSSAGITITEAAFISDNITAGGYHLGVRLLASEIVPADAVLTIAGVADSAGNKSTNHTAVHGRLSPAKIVSNEYHRARTDAFNRATDGNVNNGDNATTGFDTFDGNTGLTHFVGLLYQEAREINAIKVDLGQQFSDGGSWASLPNVYLLKGYYDTDTTRPETHPSWVLVPAQLVSGSRFNTAGDVNPSPNTPIVFDLSKLSAEDRTAYGWAVGGVSGDNTVRFLSISELTAFGFVTGTNRLTIAQEPQSQTVIDGNQAIFKVEAAGTRPMTYQWQRGGADIPDATASSYGLSPATAGDNGAEFQVIVTNPSGSLTSQVAVLSISSTTAPVVLAATLDTAIDVWFNQAVTATAADPANYLLNDPSLTIGGIMQDAYGTRARIEITGNRTVANLTIQIKNVQDLFGHTMVTQTVPVQSPAWPVIGVVASTYQQGREAALTVSTNGILAHDLSDFWTTFGRDETDFVGARYADRKTFNLIKVDLSHQFNDGGSWSELPRIFILKEPVNTDNTLPESDPRWVEIPAALISQSRFDSAVDAPGDSVPPNTPIAFDLSGVPPALRTGYGWAVGGVQGDIIGFPSFVTIGELRAFEAPGGAPTMAIRVVAGEVVISWPASATGFGLYSTPFLGSGANWLPASETAQLQGDVYIVKPASAGPKFYRLQQ